LFSSVFATNKQIFCSKISVSNNSKTARIYTGNACVKRFSNGTITVFLPIFSSKYFFLNQQTSNEHVCCSDKVLPCPPLSAQAVPASASLLGRRGDLSRPIPVQSPTAQTHSSA
jgi:hypothetical protein